jgi:2-polyprenyl-3-methyl-5-hydroxy-6-metoxy-1,4-benzoquinol methylase
MKKHPWEKAWEDKSFVIKTFEPSVLVSKYGKNLNPGDFVLDVGCGNGRNSIYLAKQGCFVDCFDVADLEWRENLPEDTKKRINFTKSSVLEYSYPSFKYQAVIVARMIQYLDRNELEFLFNKIVSSLKPGGFLLLSYNTKGGIFDQKGIKVPKYSYAIENIEALLRRRFKNIIINKTSAKSMHTNYDSDDMCAFDICAF